MDPQLEEPDLRSYLAVIARRRWLVTLTTLGFLAVALAVSLIPAPTYRVRATVQTTSVADPLTLIFGNGGGDLDRQAANEISVLNSSDIRYAVGRTYNGDLDESNIFRVTATPVPGLNENQTTSVVELALTSSDPEQAAVLLNVYARTYVELRTQTQIESFVSMRVMLNNYLADIQAQIDEVRQPITELEAQAAAGGLSDSQATELENRRDELGPQLDALAAQAGSIRAQIENTELGMATSTEGNASVISAAGVPDTPVSPNIPLNLAIGLVFGAFLGAALAFVRDYFDDSVKTKEVVDRVTGVTTLGLIPKVEGHSEVVTVSHPSAPAAEAFRSLRTAVKFLGVERQVRVVQVTSPSPSEGKTFAAVNLAVAFAQAGDRVVVVGADLRRPRLEQLLDVPLTPGLTGVLIGDVTLPQAIQSVGNVPNLSVLPAGQPPPNPSELLSGERARRLIDVLGQTYDIVVIDCPPVLPVTDSLVIARMVDTTLLVTSAHKTSKRALVRAVELLRQVDAPLAGTVLNSLSADETFSSEPYRYDTAIGATPSSIRRRMGVGAAAGGRPPGPGFDLGDEGGPADENGGRRQRRRSRNGDSGEWPKGAPPPPAGGPGGPGQPIGPPPYGPRQS
jgi:capsular exopolysaccharide synthesis family protein